MGFFLNFTDPRLRTRKFNGRIKSIISPLRGFARKALFAIIISTLRVLSVQIFNGFDYRDEFPGLREPQPPETPNLYGASAKSVEEAQWTRNKAELSKKQIPPGQLREFASVASVPLW